MLSLPDGIEAVGTAIDGALGGEHSRRPGPFGWSTVLGLGAR